MKKILSLLNRLWFKAAVIVWIYWATNTLLEIRNSNESAILQKHISEIETQIDDLQFEVRDIKSKVVVTESKINDMLPELSKANAGIRKIKETGVSTKNTNTLSKSK
jgi:peptidoglycan hydrolase CwlO-like protein